MMSASPEYIRLDQLPGLNDELLEIEGLADSLRIPYDLEIIHSTTVDPGASPGLETETGSSVKSLAHDELIPVQSHDQDSCEHTMSINGGRTLGPWTFWTWFGFCLDTIMAIVPLFFMVIAVMAACLHHKPESSTGKSVESIILLLPSIFPILFAALMGKFFKSLALYQAERGVSIGILERLVGCQSLFGAIERQISSRGIDVLGVVIILNWALSPVGGQSALRLISREQRPVNFQALMRYLPVEAANYTWLVSQEAILIGWGAFMPIYQTVLRTKTGQQSAPMDLWGNLKIPDFDLLIPAGAAPENGWYPVNESTSVTYSSLLGIPIAEMPSTGNVTFEVTSRYLKVDCPVVSYRSDSSFTNPWRTLFDATSFSMQWQYDRQYQNETMYISESPQPFYLVSEAGSYEYSIANCTIGLRDVVSSTECRDRNCHVTAMRLAENISYPRLMVKDSDTDFNVLLMMFDVLPQVNGFPPGVYSQLPAHIEGSRPEEFWLMDPDTDFSDPLSFVNLSLLDPGTMSTRLQMLLNTFWQVSYSWKYVTGDFTQNSSSFDGVPAPLPSGLSGDSTPSTFDFGSSPANMTQFSGEQYVCHGVFAVLLFLTSLLLLAAGLTSLVLKSRTLAPDILGYASTCTRDNTYFGIRAQSHVDGLERARELKDIQVMIGDVSGNSEIGHIAFADIKMNPQRLRRGRMYD